MLKFAKRNNTTTDEKTIIHIYILDFSNGFKLVRTA